MKRFERQFLVDAPIERVASFHASTTALKKLTPPPVILRLHEVEPLGEGSRSVFTMWLGPIPIRWTAVHSDVDPQKGFVDRQEQGPFQRWHHTHSFIKVDERTTLIKDEISAEFKSSLIAKLLGWLMWLNLPVLFRFRAWQTRRLTKQRQESIISRFF